MEIKITYSTYFYCCFAIASCERPDFAEEM